MTTPLRKGSLNNKEIKYFEEMTAVGMLFIHIFMTGIFVPSRLPCLFLAHFLSPCSLTIKKNFFGADIKLWQISTNSIYTS